MATPGTGSARIGVGTSAGSVCIGSATAASEFDVAAVAGTERVPCTCPTPREGPRKSLKRGVRNPTNAGFFQKKIPSLKDCLVVNTPHKYQVYEFL